MTIIAKCKVRPLTYSSSMNVQEQLDKKRYEVIFKRKEIEQLLSYLEIMSDDDNIAITFYDALCQKLEGAKEIQS